MRVENGAIGSTVSDLYTRAATKGARQLPGSSSTSSVSLDHSDLSGTGALVGLAKTLTSPGHLNRLQIIRSNISTGHYEPDPIAVSQALVSEHLNGQQQ